MSRKTKLCFKSIIMTLIVLSAVLSTSGCPDPGAPGGVSLDITLSLSGSMGEQSFLREASFSQDNSSASFEVSNLLDSIEINLKSAPDGLNITIDGESLDSATNIVLPLTVGSNTFTVVVTHADGESRSYTLTIIRAAAETPPIVSDDAALSGLSVSTADSNIVTLNPSFSPNTLNYSSDIGGGVTAVIITPVSRDDGADIEVEGTPVASGVASGEIALETGANTIEIIVTAEDGTTTQSYSIEINRQAQADTTPPVITLNGQSSMTLEVHSTYNEPGFTATDDVDGDITASVVITGSVNTSALGTYTLSYNVSDASGNPASEQTRTVEVVDTTPPVITLNGDNPINVAFESTFTDPGATVSDNYDTGLTASVTGSVNTNTAGEYTLSYSASDSSGNAAAPVTRTVNVLPPDTTPPVITLNGQSSMTLEVYSTYNEPGCTATDDVDGDITASVVITGSVNTSALGTYTLSYNVSDASGNPASEQTRTVEVVDTTPPLIMLNGDNPINVAFESTFTDPGATVSDNYDTGLTASVTGSVNTNTAGEYTLSYNVTDSSGNAAVPVERTVNVLPPDTTPPVITLNGQSSMTIEVHSTYNEPGFTATDDVDGDITASVVITGSVNTSALGTYTLSYNVSDASGNPASEQTRTVEVVDTTPPVITLNGDNPINVAFESTFTDPGATVSDNYDTGLTASAAGRVNTSTEGTYTLTYNVTDSTGNEAIPVTRTVNVLPQQAPPEIADSYFYESSAGGYMHLALTATTFTVSLQGAGEVDAGPVIEYDNESNYAIIKEPGEYQKLAWTEVVSSETEIRSFGPFDSIEEARSAVAGGVVYNAFTAESAVPPLMTLLGDNPMAVPLEGNYSEPGVSITDWGPEDGTHTVNDGGLNTSVQGIYTITYTYTDSDGNTATAEREVGVGSGSVEIIIQ